MLKTAKGLRRIATVGMTVVILLAAMIPVQAQPGRPPGEAAEAPDPERLREMAAEYPGIDYNPDYTGDMPVDEAEAYAQLDLLAEFKEAIDGMPNPAPPTPAELPPAPSSLMGDNMVQGTRWQSCEAYVGPMLIRVLTFSRVVHTIFVTYEDVIPYNITDVDENQHTTAFLTGGVTIKGILVQANYTELDRWETGPVMIWIEDWQATKAFWTLWSRFHIYYYAGPFRYTVLNRTRGCEIA